ncbi:hypothetical protein IFM89_012821 [Coptis chinensis]|uniref:Myb/SANT-like domain-containing protein n=1 Tax=Coptis chinensis TaxID=261450 RepID=A0A835H4V3_9MAGN|nr:hypothetical protein IFM89_012821 [Coptis chinensis]
MLFHLEEMSKDKRTLWTPPMDRLFIKLMVERVRDGQFLDGQFSKHAWKHMVDNFKVEFGPSYDIEVLKNHYRALKKNHIAIKTILSEGGFGWDKEREMIKVDDDNVWDDYIKAHPEFQMWRTKSMVGYDDLCTILCDRVKGDKYLKNEKSSARNGENLNGEGSKRLNLVGEGLEGLDKEMQNVENLSCKRTVWTLPMDRYFVKLLMDQVNDGQYLDGQFSKNAWKNMTDHFKAKFGSNYNIDVLKNHYRALKKNYSSIRILLGENGFTWDKDREMVKADDDHVWDDHIKVISFPYFVTAYEF